MIISFGVLLLFAQDMREWIHNFQKRILKKGTSTYTHTLTDVHPQPISARHVSF